VPVANVVNILYRVGPGGRCWSLDPVFYQSPSTLAASNPQQRSHPAVPDEVSGDLLRRLSAAGPAGTLEPIGRR